LQADFSIKQGWLSAAEKKPSQFFTLRCDTDDISLLVIHNISLPAGEFGNDHISNLFLGKIDTTAHPSFADLVNVQVSAHCLIRRDGSIIQYVSFDDKAWHAGVSSFNEVERCNDYSIGIELEGTDDIPYQQAQYQQLAQITASLQHHYPRINNRNITGHCDIAPGRKTDPGKVFDWRHFHQMLQNVKVNK